MKKTPADVLGSTFYLARIRSLEIRSYSIQIAVMVGLGFFLSLMQGASFKPFYFPLEYFMYVAYIMLFAIFFEAFFFTILEIRSQDSGAASYFTAKKAAKNSLKIMVIAIIFLVLAANPISEKTIENVSSYTKTYTLEDGNITFDMNSVDRFGLIYNYITIKGGSYTGNYDCYLMYADYYHEGMSDPASRSRLRFTDKNATEPLKIIPPDITFEEYVVIIHAPRNSTGTMIVTFHNDVKDAFVLYTGIFVISAAILHAWWFVYLQRYIKKYGTELVSV